MMVMDYLIALLHIILILAVIHLYNLTATSVSKETMWVPGRQIGLASR